MVIFDIKCTSQIFDENKKLLVIDLVCYNYLTSPVYILANVAEQCEENDTIDTGQSSLPSKEVGCHSAECSTIRDWKNNKIGIKVENKRVTHVRLSKSFSGRRKQPIIPKTFRHIAVGGNDATRSYGDLASIVSNHSTEIDEDFITEHHKEYQRKWSAAVNGNLI